MTSYKLTPKEARKLAATLREFGYKKVSARRCQDHIDTVVRFYSGGDTPSQMEIYWLISKIRPGEWS